MTEQEKIIESLNKLRTIHINDSCNGYRLSVAISKAIKALEEQEKHRWIPVSERLPEYSDDFILVQINGKYKNIKFDNAFQLATYSEEGWIVE